MSSPVHLVDASAIARDLSRLVRVPSVTGAERAAAAEVVAMAHEHGLRAQLVEYDLEALRAADVACQMLVLHPRDYDGPSRIELGPDGES